MELADLLRHRRMTRAYRPDPVPPDVLDGVLRAAARAPSAGNSQPWSFVVLEGEDTARYWDVTLPASEERERFRFPGLLRAPVLIVVLAHRDRTLARYQEDDKAHTGLGRDGSRWPVPYWLVDTAFAAMLLQLAAIDAGLGVLFFGPFRHEAAVRAALAIPDHVEVLGTIALGYPDPELERAGRSSRRPARALDEVVHRGRYGAPVERVPDPTPG